MPKPGLAILAFGKKPKDEEDGEEYSEDESGKFEKAAKAAYDAAKDDDAEGFASALEAAIECKLSDAE